MIPISVSNATSNSPVLSQSIIRPATLTDVPQMLELLNTHVRRGDVLPRSAKSIQDTIDDWLVGEDNAGISACGSLLYYTPVLAEVRSLAVHDRTKGQGVGSALVQQLMHIATQRQTPTLFTLTRAVHFFAKLGFTITDKNHYPQKVWKDCHICPLLTNCDETAMEYFIK
jgi:amino-acid N-acetyltransferase